MGMVVVLSHIIFTEANPRFQMGYRTRLSCYPKSSLLTLDAPQVLSPAEAASIFVHSGEATNALEREALAAVLELDDSEAGEHLSAAEVEPDSFTRITEKIKEPDVSDGN